MRRMNILAIGAHPDDIEFGCAGTLVKYATKHHRIFLMILTKGGEGGDQDIRAKEQIDAGKRIGAEKIFWGNYRDTRLFSNKRLINDVEAVIGQVRPDFIFTHFPEDTHQDHRHLSQATISATRYIRNVLFFEGPTTQHFTPQVYVDISATLDQKVETLQAHFSQIGKTNIEDMNIVELARSTANFRGIQGRVKFAEAFASLRLFINI